MIQILEVECLSSKKIEQFWLLPMTSPWHFNNQVLSVLQGDEVVYDAMRKIISDDP